MFFYFYVIYVHIWMPSSCSYNANDVHYVYPICNCNNNVYVLNWMCRIFTTSTIFELQYDK
jgi:hypothetical protein